MALLAVLVPQRRENGLLLILADPEAALVSACDLVHGFTGVQANGRNLIIEHVCWWTFQVDKWMSDNDTIRHDTI